MSTQLDLSFTDTWHTVYALGMSQGREDGVYSKSFELGYGDGIRDGEKEDIANIIIRGFVADSPFLDGGLSDANSLRNAYGAGYEAGKSLEL